MNPADIQNMIDRYAAAELSVLEGKSITFNGQQMTLQNLTENRKGPQEWEPRQATLNNKRRGRPGYRLARFG